MLNRICGWLSVSRGQRGSEHDTEAFVLVLRLTWLTPTSGPLHSPHPPSGMFSPTPTWRTGLLTRISALMPPPSLPLREASLITSANTTFLHSSRLCTPFPVSCFLKHFPLLEVLDLFVCCVSFLLKVRMGLVGGGTASAQAFPGCGRTVPGQGPEAEGHRTEPGRGGQVDGCW